MSQRAKIGLGTAQWGMPYGIANRSGQPTSDEVHRMLGLAQECQVLVLDTAYAYGQAEELLGQHGVGAQGFHVVTKTRPLPASAFISEDDVDSVVTGFEDSLRRLHCQQVYGLLAHQPDALLKQGGQRLWRKLEELKAQGLVEKIGVSAYGPRQLADILDRYHPDLVQVPFSIYDQRFKEQGLLESLRRRHIEVHARSAFLQGVLLLPSDKLPGHFKDIRNHQAALHARLNDMGLTPLEGCLLFCLQQEGLDRIIVGCETLNQLRGVVAVGQYLTGSKDLDRFAEFRLQDELIVNASTWKYQRASVHAEMNQ